MAYTATNWTVVLSYFVIQGLVQVLFRDNLQPITVYSDGIKFVYHKSLRL